MGSDTPVDMRMTDIDGGVTAPAGFAAAAVAAGVRKSGRLDVAVIAAAGAVPAAAVFTTNKVAAAPVIVSREHVADGMCRAVVVNAGNANACTGPRGLADARTMADTVARTLGCPSSDVIVASTGVIGAKMPMDAVTAGVTAASAALGSPEAGDPAEAIMTTDTFAKRAAVRVETSGREYTVGGIAKGSGMIQPNMATMLAFVTTDAPLTSEACDAALRAAVPRTFNRVTVDSDTSTNDMCMLMASGEAGERPIGPDAADFAAVAEAVLHVCGSLARMIARDGEGATKLVDVTVTGALTESDAEAAAFSIANSPLVKTALFGGDANWGRVAAAVGKSAAAVDPDRLEVRLAGITMCVDGTGLDFDEDAAARALAEDQVSIEVDLHLGDGEATVWTCDLSYDYVRINGDYRS